MTKEELFAMIKGTVIVSCQAVQGEPLYVPEKSIMYLMGRAAKLAGTKMIRTSSVRDIIGIKEETGLPVIGLVKRNYPGFSGEITMTMREIDECMAAEADIIALDCCDTPRGDGLTPTEFIKQVKQKYPNAILMADCSTYEEAMRARAAGCDLVGTTMSGYTPQSAHVTGPDFEMVRRLKADIDCPVIAEGHCDTPELVCQMLEAGAHAVVVGSAITRPYEIAKRFIHTVEEYHRASGH